LKKLNYGDYSQTTRSNAIAATCHRFGQPQAETPIKDDPPCAKNGECLRSPLATPPFSGIGIISGGDFLCMLGARQGDIKNNPYELLSYLDI
jgi:hypothetical protein